MPAYFHTTLRQFLDTNPVTILGTLTSSVQHAGFQTVMNALILSWEKEISILNDTFRKLIDHDQHTKDWHILLEYPIPRRQKRIDGVLLAQDLIFVLEFKINSSSSDLVARRQVEDYGLDLHDFHERSVGHSIIPILIPSEYPSTNIDDINIEKTSVLPTVVTGTNTLLETIWVIFQKIHDPDKPPINVDEWNYSAYHPVPTIIEAAEHLYANHQVQEIAHAHADPHNLDLTIKAIVKAVQEAQNAHKKIICFVTGVPGSGKTLTGLTAAHNPELMKNGQPAGIFLSGNGPLVKIVSEALARDKHNRSGDLIGKARREVTTFIQNVHVFINEYLNKGFENLPYERVVIFDEAQRAWDLEKSRRKFGREMSEPVTILSILDRYPDWAVIVALVGGGQEIYDGEAGLAEWGRSIGNYFPHWEIRTSPEVLVGGNSDSGNTLFIDDIPSHLKIILESDLHLPVSIRSYKAEEVSHWVNAVLEGDSDTAINIAKSIQNFPILLTRSLEEARYLLKKNTRGERRCGLVASSGALRLRAYGIEISTGFTQDYPYHEWFLAPPEDIRSSYRLEVAATEFQCQGLELDWVGLCWGDDFTWNQAQRMWEYRILKGPRWQNIRKVRDQVYLRNKYRVLMTRAREGMIIWIPCGDVEDSSRNPNKLNQTADYLRKCLGN
jgi:hypothetical protein